MQTSIIRYLEGKGIPLVPVDPKICAEYDRQMREETIPAIERAMKASRRAAHYFKLGIPDPLK